MIAFDQSKRSTVVVCSCGWRDVFTSREIALRAAADHERGHSLEAAARMRERHARIVANRQQRGRSG